jgi:hypothetical protein
LYSEKFPLIFFFPWIADQGKLISKKIDFEVAIREEKEKPIIFDTSTATAS